MSSGVIYDPFTSLTDGLPMYKSKNSGQSDFMFKKNIDSQKLIQILQGADKQPIIMKQGKKKFFTSTNRRLQPEPEKSRNSNYMHFSLAGNTE